MARLAILGFGGALPVAIAQANPDAMQITLKGIPSALGAPARCFELEKIGTLFAALKSAGVTRLVFAGALTRPPLNPAAFDADMTRIAPHLMQALTQGDDALLRQVITVFEEQGFEVLGASEVLPEICAQDGLCIGPEPTARDWADVARGAEILAAMSPLDIGQGCAVAAGLCLGIETIQGTDAILRYVAQTDPALKRGQKGVYVKAAKRGQDLRIDMPAIGPDTLRNVAAAGLGGLVVEAGKVVLLEREATLQAARDAGIFLIAKAL